MSWCNSLSIYWLSVPNLYLQDFKIHILPNISCCSNLTFPKTDLIFHLSLYKTVSSCRLLIKVNGNSSLSFSQAGSFGVIFDIFCSHPHLRAWQNPKESTQNSTTADHHYFNFSSPSLYHLSPGVLPPVMACLLSACCHSCTSAILHTMLESAFKKRS